MAEKEAKKSLKDIIKQINKTCKEWDILSSGNFSKDLRKLSLRSLGFDYPFKGGLPYGQITTISGVEHSGKSTIAAIAMGEYQQENPDKICVYVDAENTLLTQADYFQTISKISYDEDHFVRYDCTGRSAEEIFQDLITMQASDEIGMIVIDSARALISQADLDNDFTKDNGQRASIAKSMGKFLKQMMMYLPKRNNILLILNQVDVIKDMFSTTYTEPCGYALKYFPSVKVRCGTRTFTQGNKTDISSGKATDDCDGIQLHFAIVKSRIGNFTKTGGMITIRFNDGIDTAFDLITVAQAAQLILSPDGKTQILTDFETGEVLVDEETGTEMKFTGERALKNYLASHPNFVKKYSELIINHISKTKTTLNLVDEATLKEIFDQEAALCPTEMTAAQALAADGVDNE